MEEDVKFYRLHLLHGTCSYPRGVRSYILFCKGLKFTVFRIVGQVVLKDPRGSVAPQGFPLWVGIYRRAELHSRKARSDDGNGGFAKTNQIGFLPAKVAFLPI